MTDKVLLHVCCAPCALAPYRRLQQEGLQVQAFFFNPNIQPYKEFCRRRDTVRQWAEAEGWQISYDLDYPLEQWVRAALADGAGRCHYCYLVRLERAAAEAKLQGCRYFTTSLLISPYQQHELIAAVGKAVGERAGVEFLYRDFRTNWEEGVRISREQELYRQPYCGCVFSERDRYFKKARKT